MPILVQLLALCVAWFVLRAILILPLGLRAARVDVTPRSPFGPSGKVRTASSAYSGCLFPIVSALVAAVGAVLAVLAYVPRPAGAANLIFPSIAAGVVGFVAGFWVDLGVAGRVETELTVALLRRQQQQLSTWLTVGTDDDKMRAACLVGLLASAPGSAEFVAPVLDALQSANPEARYRLVSALRALAQAHRDLPAEAEEPLRDLLSDPECKVRAPAALALVTARQATIAEVVEPLASALLSEDPTAQGMVTYFLDAPGRCTHLVIPQIFEAVERHGEPFASGGIQLVFRWIDPAGRPALEAGRAHANPLIRRLAIKGLDHIDARR